MTSLSKIFEFGTVQSPQIVYKAFHIQIFFALVQSGSEFPNSEILNSGNIALSTLHLFCGLRRVTFRAQRGNFFRLY